MFWGPGPAELMGPLPPPFPSFPSLPSPFLSPPLPSYALIHCYRGEIFSLKFTKYRLAAGLRLDPPGELKRSTRPPSRNKGAYFKGEGREGRVRDGRVREGRGREGKGKGELAPSS